MTFSINVFLPKAKKASIDGLMWRDLVMVVRVGSGGGGGGRGVTKGFACNTPQSSCRPVNVYVHAAQTVNTSTKLFI